MTQAPEWLGKTGTSWAQEWQRTDRSFLPLTDRLIDPAALGRFGRVLDIGCGAGELIARLAPAQPAARLTGIDISAELLAVARTRCAAFGNARFEEADAAVWTGPADARPDLLLSRHGVMFFADPVAAFAHLRTQSMPGAQLRFSCFRARKDNRWVAALESALPASPAPADPYAPGPFAFGDREHVTAILARAGWQDIAFESVDYAMVAGEGADPVGEAFAYFQRIGPAARALVELPGPDRLAAQERMRAVLAEHRAGDCVALPAACWIVTARAP